MKTFAERIWEIEPSVATRYLDECMAQGVKANADDGIRAIVLRGSLDDQFFALTFMPESFDDAMTHQHDAVWAIMQDDSIAKSAVCAWRGFGKTTMWIARRAKLICYRLFKFSLLIGSSHDLAAQITENLKTELLTNQRIRYVFGYFKTKSYEGNDVGFSKKAWFACDPESGQPFYFVVPKGAGQGVRGLAVHLMGRVTRPDDIGIDDVEKDDEVQNEETRKKIRRWYHGSLEPCVGRNRPNPKTGRWPKGALNRWRITYLDTLKHEDALMSHLLSDSEYVSLRLPQAERREVSKGEYKYFSLVPELISNSQVRRERALAEQRMELDTWCREKLCIPVAPESAMWTRDSFKYFKDSELRLGERSDIERFVVVDPARTTNPKSAYTAIVAFALDRKEHRIYIRDVVNARLDYNEMTQRAFDMALATRSNRIAVEETGLHMYVHQQFENARRVRRLQDISFVWLGGQSIPKTGDYGSGREAIKRARASMVHPYYAAGNVFHEGFNVRGSALEDQQLSFPLCSKWDALDCVGYIPIIMQECGLYFTPKKRAAFEVDENAVFRDPEEWDRLTRMIRRGDYELDVGAEMYG